MIDFDTLFHIIDYLWELALSHKITQQEYARAWHILMELAKTQTIEESFARHLYYGRPF